MKRRTWTILPPLSPADWLLRVLASLDGETLGEYLHDLPAWRRLLARLVFPTT